MSLCAPKTLSRALICAAALTLHFSLPAAAQQRFQYVGPSECLNCHDHQAERQWYERQEIPEVARRFPAKGKNAGHINALKQLETAKSTEFARATGLRDKYDLNGSCVKCHATVFQHDANAGVSCESCHGPGSGYLKPHQTKGAYTPSLALGMVDIVGKIPAWAQQCANCHVMDDPRLVAAGHPSGDDFDLGEKFGPVGLHFKRKYSAGDVSAISRDVVRGIIARRRGGRGPAPAAAPTEAPTVAPVTPARPPDPVEPPRVPNAPPPPIPPPVGSAPSAGRAEPTPRSEPSSPVAAPDTQPAAGGSMSAAVNAPATGSVSASVAMLQGRLIELLTQMLQRGATVPVRTGTPPPALAPYSGPDAALLQLQRDAIALALEVLGSPPAAPAKPR